MARLDTYPAESMIQNYRRVFSSPHGLELLEHMLFELGVFDMDLTTEQDIVLRNYGMRLLNILSGGEIGDSSLKVLMKSIMKQQIIEPLRERKQNND